MSIFDPNKVATFKAQLDAQMAQFRAAQAYQSIQNSQTTGIMPPHYQPQGPSGSLEFNSMVEAQAIAMEQKRMVIRNMFTHGTYRFMADHVAFNINTRVEYNGDMVISLWLDGGDMISRTVPAVEYCNLPLGTIVENYLPAMMTELVVFLKMERMP